ncbi:MAG: hypothetical protein JWM87_890 [Candidatus Eremiobacteraeota bacterium]|nr:hypothetical protein [Candidatus Eremiobacteraeota bacterium]
MTVDKIVPILIVAVVVISSVASGLKQAKRGFDKVVEKQRAQEPERLARVQAELARRGVTAPPALQRLLSALESAAPETPTAPPSQQQPAYAPQAAYAAQPAYASPQQQQQAVQRHSRHKHQQQPQQPPPPEVRRAPQPIARSVDVPVFPSVPVAAAVGTTRRTLADAFGDPAHARNAVILMEVLAPPVALR